MGLEKRLEGRTRMNLVDQLRGVSKAGSKKAEAEREAERSSCDPILDIGNRRGIKFLVGERRKHYAQEILKNPEPYLKSLLVSIEALKDLHQEQVREVLYKAPRREHIPDERSEYAA